MAPKVIAHCVEKRQRGRYCAGQWKDIEALNQVLGQLPAKFEFLEFDGDDIESLAHNCASVGATDIILYYSFMPEVLSRLKKEIPTARLYVRTVNAEAFQHWQRSEVGWQPSYKNLRSIYGSFRLAYRDSQCKKLADGLLGISNWDNRFYWNRLPGKAETFNVTYSCPWPEIRPSVKPLPWAERANAIVCLAGGRDPIGQTMLDGFNSLADALGGEPEFSEWEFLLSPGLRDSDQDDKLSDHVRRLERLDEPWDFLCSVKALAVLTPLGFGFKTTILDALTAGCNVLVDNTLARRLPKNLMEKCIQINSDECLMPQQLANRLNIPSSPEEVVEGIKRKAKKELLAALAIHLGFQT